ncbi:hypothetical protein MPNT_120064 [Candidatus Methylacidithermus pantelleriae]|uniref:Uncharacterized protein n=1 Tax=Candidatus Methylacidithermus pantelleriae TaxID=2744239 RepID=A0A8J2BKC5_9BACT|nr:hypothetical protein MPNT_120064 [Candidatus Methylacidithermus pantelleriae]
MATKHAKEFVRVSISFLDASLRREHVGLVVPGPKLTTAISPPLLAIETEELRRPPLESHTIQRAAADGLPQIDTCTPSGISARGSTVLLRTWPMDWTISTSHWPTSAVSPASLHFGHDIRDTVPVAHRTLSCRFFTIHHFDNAR